jgi:opacity protein-like surface antigen
MSFLHILQNFTKIVLFACCFCLFSKAVFAQKKEFGFGLGASNYTGDVSPSFEFRNLRPAGNLFLRYNLNKALSLRFDATIGGIAAADSYYSKDPFMKQRNYVVSGSFREISARIEYNFSNFRTYDRFDNFCPYLFGGIAGVNYSGDNSQVKDYNEYNFSIPFGIGVKYYLSKQWNLGADFGARKMFADNFDGLVQLPNATKYQKLNEASTDMYFFIGFYVSHVITKIKCPEEFR